MLILRIPPRHHATETGSLMAGRLRGGTSVRRCVEQSLTEQSIVPNLLKNIEQFQIIIND